MSIRKKSSTDHGRLAYLFGDCLAIAAAYFTMIWLRFQSEWGKSWFSEIFGVLGIREPIELGDRLLHFYVESAPRIILFLCLTICLLYALRDLYAGRRFIRRRPIAWEIVVVNILALAMFYCYFYARRNVFHPRSVFAIVAFLNVIYAVGFRALAGYMLSVLRRKSGIGECRAVVVGSSEDTERIAEFIEVVRPHGMRVAARVGLDASGEDGAALAAKVSAAVTEHDAGMIVCADKRLKLPQIMQLVGLSGELGIAAKVYTDKMDVLINQAGLAADRFRGVPLVHFAAPADAGGWRRIRRGIDFALACIGLVALSPVLLLIALAVRLTSSGPAIYVQERVGIAKKPFKMYKFRTMHQLADELQAGVEEFNEAGLGLFKIRQDPRVTTIGRLLRRFSLDEMPQLANVLRGEMAIVGPRPLPWRDFKQYSEEWHYMRHSITPGLTGLWQVSGRSDTDFHNMCILDIYYLRNEGFILDLKIILKTLWVVLFAKGAY